MSSTEPGPGTKETSQHLQEGEIPTTPSEYNEPKEQHQEKVLSAPETTISGEIKSRTKKWLLATYEVLLSVLHVTLTIILVTVGDVIVITVINWLLGNPSDQSFITEKFLEGVKILSVFGVSATYSIYLVYSLLQDVKHVKKLSHEDS